MFVLLANFKQNISVLQCAAEYVKGRHLPSIFTFPKVVVLNWFARAKHACAQACYVEDEQYYGGPPFAWGNSTTHWTEPSQLFTWWKNNIERKAKYSAMLSEAFYTGSDERKLHWLVCGLIDRILLFVLIFPI